MTGSEPSESAQDVPTLIFTKFIETLRDADVSPEIVSRLSKALLDDKTFGEAAIKAAVISEAPPL